MPDNIIAPPSAVVAPPVQDNDIIPAPAIEISASMQGEVPKACYLGRIVKCTDGRSNKSDKRQLTLDCEIVAPDVVPSQMVEGVQCATAGRRFSMYPTLDQSDAKRFSESRILLKTLGLLLPDGAIHPALIVNTCAKGDIFFYVVLESEEDFHRLPSKIKGQLGEIMKSPIDQAPMSRGWRIKLPNVADVQRRVAPPEGFVAMPAPF